MASTSETQEVRSLETLNGARNFSVSESSFDTAADFAKFFGF
jgi:hypothetical protein